MTRPCTFPREPGVYALLIRAAGAGHVAVGKWGTLGLRPGDWFVYIGSAMRGLSSRLERHVATTGKRMHWHVDYLLSMATVQAVLFAVTTSTLECAVSSQLSAFPQVMNPVPGFGNSDCTRCPSHLYRVAPGASPVDAIACISRAFAREGHVATTIDMLEGSNQNGQPDQKRFNPTGS